MTLKELFDIDEPWYNGETDMALESIMDGDIHIGKNRLCDIIYDQFQPNSNMDSERVLMRFTSFPIVKDVEDCRNNPIIKDIQNNKITLSAPANFNDPMDPLIKAWAEYKRNHQKDKIDKKFYKLLYDVINHVRICCLVNPKNKGCQILSHKTKLPIENCNPLMWAHYAKNHTGVCIQYRISPDLLLQAQESQKIILKDVDYNKKVTVDGDSSFEDSFILKGNYWAYENETRLVLFSKNMLPQYYSIPNVPIEAVYMGYRISPKLRDILRDISKKNNFNLYQMVFNPHDLSNLIAHQIN